MRAGVNTEMKLPIEMHRAFRVPRVEGILHPARKFTRFLDLRFGDGLGGFGSGEAFEGPSDEAKLFIVACRHDWDREVATRRGHDRVLGLETPQRISDRH